MSTTRGSVPGPTPRDVADERLFPRPLLDALASQPGRTAFEAGARAVSCGEALAIVERLVDRMRAAGLGRGSGVALLTGLTVEGFAANVAAHARGCRVVGIRPGWSPPQLAAVLDRDLDAVVGDASTLTPDLLAAVAETTSPVTALSLGPRSGAADLLAGTGRAGSGAGAGEPGGPPSGAVESAGTADGSGGHPVPVEARADDIARVNFTSGSTGVPKGCARTYGTYSLMYRPETWAPDLARLMAGFQRVLIHSSFSHPVMLTFAARSLIAGGTVVLPEAHLRPFDRLAEAIERYRATGLVIPVPALHRLLAALRERPRHLGSLRALVVTGSPASPELLVAATEQLGPVVWQGYGQAESGMISLLTPDDILGMPERALTSVGRLLPEVELDVRDPDDGRSLPPGDGGEICVRSPHAMAGYWDDPEQTHEVLRDGWLHTRDLGRLDSHGFLHLTGRSRDVIMVNAEICYAGAVERALARHPDVDQAYVVGVPDERTGEAIHAFVVPTRPGLVPDEQALTALVVAELTSHHVPTTITPIAEVPTTPDGKPDKRALTALVESRVEG